MLTVFRLFPGNSSPLQAYQYLLSNVVQYSFAALWQITSIIASFHMRIFDAWIMFVCIL